MDYHTLDSFRQSHPAWKLLRADNAALIVSFLHRSYIATNDRTLREADLVSRLEDYLYHLRREIGEEDAFPRGAAAYLEDWASDRCAWLRKYYKGDDDEPHFDITPAAEQTIGWLASLSQRSFIGTESRLLTIFELLRRLVEGAETDMETRLLELERRRAQIDQEIAQAKAGTLPLIDDTGVRERFLQVSGAAQALLSDFRAVEQNFRNLDRAARERIAAWEGGKGELLAQLFGDRDAIADSDQGKSFMAFWDFLMSPARQEELTRLLEKVFALDAVQQLKPDRRVLSVHYDWLAAGEVTQRTVAKLSAELRRYLDDKAWLENRRIMGILREIEMKALELRDDLPDGPFMTLDEMSADVRLVMDRPLYSPPQKPEINDTIMLSKGEEVPADALFDRVYVDKARLAAHIRRALQRRSQVSLSEIVENHPLEHGLAELVAYLSLASEDPAAAIDDDHRQTVVWTDPSGVSRQATLPHIVFARAAAPSAIGPSA
jgi:hypothetical protein